MSIISGDANPVATTDEMRFSKNMKRAPLGQKLQLINLGGVAVYGTLSEKTRGDYLEWCKVPKRAIDTEDEQ